MIYHIRSKREGITNRLADEHNALIESLGYKTSKTICASFVEIDSLNEFQKKIGFDIEYEVGTAMLTILD